MPIPSPSRPTSTPPYADRRPVRLGRLRDDVSGAVRTLAQVLLPQRCLGCAAADTPWCASCLLTTVRLARTAPDPTPAGFPPTWAAGPYTAQLRAAVVGYKDRGRVDLAEPLARLLAGVVRTAIGAFAADRSRWPGPAADPPRMLVWLVPVPSRPAAVRARGRDHLLHLAELAARRVAASGTARVRVVRAVRHTTRATDSAGLTSAGRATNARGAFVLGRSPPPADAADPAGRPALVVLVDDVVTTGATLGEAARVLRAGFVVSGAGTGGGSGGPPLVAAVIAATQRRAGAQLG